MVITEPKYIHTPAKELQQLSIFLGKWQIEGQNYEHAPQNPNTKITGETVYEWMPGEFFLINKWERHSGDINHHIGMSLTSFEESSGFFSTENFDNTGCNKTFVLITEGKIWKLIGDTQRGTIEFNRNGNSFTEVWEISIDKGETWFPFYSFQARRVSSL